MIGEAGARELGAPDRDPHDDLLLPVMKLVEDEEVTRRFSAERWAPERNGAGVSGIACGVVRNNHWSFGGARGRCLGSSERPRLAEPRSRSVGRRGH